MGRKWRDKEDEMDEGIGFRVRGEGVYIGKRKKSEIGKDGVN